MQTFEFEAVINGTEIIFDITEEKLHILAQADVVKLNEDSTMWVLNEDSEHYELAMTLLSLGE